MRQDVGKYIITEEKNEVHTTSNKLVTSYRMYSRSQKAQRVKNWNSKHLRDHIGPKGVLESELPLKVQEEKEGATRQKAEVLGRLPRTQEKQ